MQERTHDLETIQASVAHELRNLLESVSIEVARMQLADPEGHANRLATSVRRMAEVVERLVCLSRADHSTFEPCPIDMTALVRELWEERLTVEPSSPPLLVLEELPPALADPMLIRILLENLIDNALKYTRPRRRRIVEIDAQRQGGEVIYHIRDNGRGFESSPERLFEPFTRAARGETEPGGLGLGLAIARRVVRRHGGRIWASRDPCRGRTAFSFSLRSGPRTASADPAPSD